jgi:flagellar protein FliL
VTATLTPDASAPAADPSSEKAKGKAKSRSNLVPAVIIAIGLVAGGFLMGGKGSAPATVPASADEHVEEPEPEPEPGSTMVLDPITLNLADGRYLKVALALVLAKDAHVGGGGGHGGGEVDTAAFSAKALDETITVLGARTYPDLRGPDGRAAAKEVLTERIAERYHGDVLEVYFTEFVMQ